MNPPRLILLLFTVLITNIPSQGQTQKRFVVYSDNRGANDVHAKVLSSLARRPPHMILHLGDLVDPYRRDGLPALKAQVAQHFGTWDRFCRNLYLSIGGHEERWMNRHRIAGGAEPDNAAGQAFYREVSQTGRMRSVSPYGDYTFQALGVHFVVMYISDEWWEPRSMHRLDRLQWRQEAWLNQALWLAERLQAIRTVAPRAPLVVAAHKKNWFLTDQRDPAQPRSLMAQLLKEHSVDLALAGDAHDYFAQADGPTLKLRDGSPGHGVAMYLDIEVLADRFRITARTPTGAILNSPLFSSQWEKPFGSTPKATSRRNNP